MFTCRPCPSVGMGVASFFVWGDSVGADRKGTRGQKTRAGASLSKVNPPQYTSEAYPGLEVCGNTISIPIPMGQFLFPFPFPFPCINILFQFQFKFCYFVPFPPEKP